MFLDEAISLSNKIIVLTKRPAKVKSVHNIAFDETCLPTKRRRTAMFNEYYDIIWKEIDNHV